MKRNEEELELVAEIFDELIARVSNFSDDDLNLLTCDESAPTNAADHVRTAALKAECEYRRRGESTPPHVASAITYQTSKRAVQSLATVSPAIAEPRSTEEVERGDSGKRAEDTADLRMDKRVEKIIQMMREDVRGELSLAEFAQSVNLSVWRLCHIFKSDVGMPPMRYLRLLRMERAKDLLESSFLSVKEIAYRVGLNDESIFVRDFKSIYGSSPAHYRSHLRRSVGEQRPDEPRPDEQRPVAKFEGIEARNGETIWLAPATEN